MFIKKESIDKVIESADVYEVIKDFVQLKKQGSNYVGLSPITAEKTPSFTVSPVKQIWKCFSSGQGGHPISFLMKVQGMTFPDAIKYLANKSNIILEYDDSEDAKKELEKIKKKDEVRPLLDKVQKLYMAELKKRKEGHPAIIEILRRGYTQDDVIEWGIGYAPGFKFLYDQLKEQGQIQPAKDLGLITDNDWDMYSKRVTYPIHDRNGLIVGFAGRTVNPDDKTKWINPVVKNSNVLYNKSTVWYGMHKAKFEINKTDEANIVEGYNDVIAFHKYGKHNTVASCGTSITDGQIKELRKICSKVNFVMDPDKAGKAAVLKAIPRFIESGFRTFVTTLEQDPDDYCRLYADNILQSKSFDDFLKKNKIEKVDGFKVLMTDKLQGDDIDKSKGAEHLCRLIAKIEDASIASIYTDWLIKESKIRLANIKDWINKEKELLQEIIEWDDDYELPAEVKIPFSKLENDIKKYSLFMANHKIWMQTHEALDKRKKFSAVSNFEIEVLQHMNDEKFPMKLIRIKNTDGIEKIFDTLSENLNTPQAFDNTMTGHGNFRFDGNRNLLLQLRRYLFDKMGNGKKIDILGWQPEAKMWVWSNGVVLENGEEHTINENGIIVHEKVHYYIPAANSIYKNNFYKFEAQKRFRVIKSPVPINLFLEQCMKVHRDHFISAFLFGLACLFRDVIVEKLNRFPLLFLYGPGGTGKDELAEIVQGLTGLPQTAINLEAELSTGKASIRELAQFTNGISQLSEYKRGNKNIDGMLKQIYDCRGYKRGNIESHVGVDSIPVVSGVVLTGNDYPDSEPLIQRLIWNEMIKNNFSDFEIKEFDKLKDMMYQGISGYSNEILKHRVKVVELFEKKQRAWKSILKERFPDAKERMIANLSILSGLYEIFRDHVDVFTFPFSQTDMLTHFEKGINQQLYRINSYSIMNRFWECFITSMRGPIDDRIQARRIVNIEHDKLYIQWTHCYGKVQKQWWMLHKEAPPKKETVLEEIKKVQGLFHDQLSKYSFDTGRQAVRSSAIVLNLAGLTETMQEDIKGSFLFQLNEDTLFDDNSDFFSESPATPNGQKILKENEKP